MPKLSEGFMTRGRPSGPNNSLLIFLNGKYKKEANIRNIKERKQTGELVARSWGRRSWWVKTSYNEAEPGKSFNDSGDDPPHSSKF